MKKQWRMTSRDKILIWYCVLFRNLYIIGKVMSRKKSRSRDFFLPPSYISLYKEPVFSLHPLFSFVLIMIFIPAKAGIQFLFLALGLYSSALFKRG
jgi:hypothetical protein